MISFVVPTRDRPEDLARTLAGIGVLELGGGAEVIVVDNASRVVPVVPERLSNGVAVRLELLERNAAAASRNVGAKLAGGDWLVMLDDDSHPVMGGESLGALLDAQPSGVAAVMADIRLPHLGRREAGGLPEVWVGCGVAIRRGVYLELGGYDASFGYYAEEYDLAARVLAAGHRAAFEPRFVVQHHKVDAGRDMGLILERLVRNNGWVMQRYAPEAELAARLDELIGRYRVIAIKEGALAGFERGVAELERTIGDQRRTPLSREHWDRFTGLAAAREALGRAHAKDRFATAELVGVGKNAWVVEQALDELGVEIVEHGGEVRVVASMSPGPMLDAMQQTGHGRMIAPWIGAAELVRA